ncbi:hypothetical protein JXB41_07105 [Candidatus Woesearchaeota archaeon]|nr:hypothetical protein [Candidatus Woesearchaeota archaeon]
MDKKQSIKEIKKIQRKLEKEISTKTINEFSKHLKYIDLQYDILQEILRNYYLYGNIKHDEPNQFLTCFALLNNMIHKEKICKKLILRGHYSESAALVRHIMESAFHIIYLAKFPDTYNEWWLQQKYYDNRILKKFKVEIHRLSSNNFNYMFRILKNNISQETKKYLLDSKKTIFWLAESDDGGYIFTEDVPNPNTEFSSFYRIAKKLNLEMYKRLYQRMCSWAHPGIETVRSNFDLQPNGLQKYHFTPRYNPKQAEFQSNIIFGFINEAVWQGLANIIIVIEPIPKLLSKYDSMQEKARTIFHRFYL